MKKFYAFFILMAALLAASAQTVDFEIVGFVDSDGNTISSLVLRPSQDLQPRVKLKNNGPDAVAATDSVIFDVTYNEGLHVTSVILMGTELHSVVAGEDVTVDLLQPIWTAATMSQYGLTECNLCYEVRIAGHSTDPNPANNKACIDVTRTVSVGDDDVPSVSLFPNPASASVILAGAENARVQLFDLSGKQISVIERACESQQLDVSALSAGLYVVRISDGKSVVTKKLNVVR